MGSAPEDSPGTAVSQSPVLTCWRSQTTPRSVFLDMRASYTCVICRSEAWVPGLGGPPSDPPLSRPLRERVRWDDQEREPGAIPDQAIRESRLVSGTPDRMSEVA